MHFLVYDPHYDPATDTGAPPSDEMMEAMGSFIGEAMQAGVIVTTGALPPTGTRLRLSEGKFTVTDGPFIEAKELMLGFAVINVPSVEDAIEWSKRFRQIVGDGESEIVPIMGPGSFLEE